MAGAHAGPSLSGTSLQWRLLGLSLATITLTLLIAGAGLSELFSRHVERRAFAELENHTRVLLASLDISTDGTLVQTSPPADPHFATPYGGLYWQVSEDGKTVLRSRSLWDFEIAAPHDELSSGSVHKHHLAGPDGASLLALERPLRLGESGASRSFRILVAQDRKLLLQATSAFNHDLILALAGLAIVLFSASIFQTRRGLAPLSGLRGRLAEVRNATQHRIQGGAPAEVQPLIDEINALLDQRDASIVRARSRAADLAHGLKTPLTALDGDVRRLRDLRLNSLADDIGAVSALMRRHVQSELTRARIAGSQNLASVNVQVRPAVEAIVAVAARLPDGQALSYSIDIGAEDKLRMDADDFNEVMGNLIENAVRHARKVVRISLHESENGGTIEVADDGPGIDPDDIDRVLQRGQSRDTRGSGAGLGLSIVTEILEAYGSRLVLETRQGEGLAARFLIPNPSMS